MALFPPKNPAPAPVPIPMPVVSKPSTLSAEDINRAKQIGARIRARFAQTLVGQDNLRESLITTLVAGGHILIESVPGLAKTTAAQTLATSVSGSFKRVQCTPDLMPSDLVGTQVFDFATQKFSTQIGPIHANSCCSTKSTVRTRKHSRPCLKPCRRSHHHRGPAHCVAEAFHGHRHAEPHRGGRHVQPS